MRAPRLFLIWGFLTGIAAGFASATPPLSLAEPVGESRDAPYFTFRVTAPAPLLSRLPDGSTQIRLDGFARRDARVGAPDLPFQVFRVAIPPGVTPRLEIATSTEDALPGTRPGAIPRRVASVSPETESGPAEAARVRDGIRDDVVRSDVSEPDDEIYRGRQPWPRSIASIVAVGVFRDQRYVDVRVNPVRFDPAIRGLRIARSLEITVRFDGDALLRSAPAAASRLEDVYRTMFLNYAQGSTFRVNATTSGAAPAASAVLAPAVPGPIQKIKIRRNGVVRLDAARMGGTGFTSQPLSAWKMSNRGVEVPLDVHDVNANDLLDAGDWVQLYGQALDDEPKAVLNTDIAGTDQDIFEVGDFTDENVYVLTTEVGARARMAVRDGTATNTRTPPTDFVATAHAEIDDGWRPLGGNDPWYWLPAISSSGTISRTDAVALPGLAPGAAGARVILVVRGITDNPNLTPDHHTRVSLLDASSSLLASNDDDGSFDGRTIYTHDFTWTYPGSGAVLTNPVRVRLESRPIATGTHDVMLNWIDVNYPRSFQAAGDVLTFDWPDGDAEFQLSGLTSSAPEVWELTGRVGGTGVVDAVRVTGAAVTGAGPFSVRFRIDDEPLLANGTLRRFVVFGGGAVTVPADPDFQPDTVSDLRTNAVQADLIVIAHPAVLGAASQATLNQLLAWRLANQGITAKIAMIGDVEDEFNDGLPGPNAIRRFLKWVMSTAPGEGWADPKPAYVFLLGDGSYDFKHGTANGSFVPTAIMLKDDPQFGYYASDSSLAAVVGGDAMPDLVVGRISARGDAECDGVLQKILSYEQAPPPGNWQRHALVVSDRGKDYDTLEAADFEATNDAALSTMKRPPHTSRRLRYWTDYCMNMPPLGGCTVAKAAVLRGDIKAAVNGTDGISDGAAILQYVGHGNFDVWSDDAFFDNRDDAGGGLPPSGRDTDDLANGVKLPAVFIHNCLNGGFMSTAVHTLGEDWANRATGGAVALFSPSGLSYLYFGQVASDRIWSDFFGKTKARDIAVPVMDVYADLCGVGSIDPCQNYVLLGDPATRMVFPTVAPATGVMAVPGNARVDLTWTASATSGARYDVYRSAPDLPSGTYTRVNGAVPIEGTTFADTGLTNAKTYYYYVVAQDVSGFESRWSNFNSDCAVAGPDCLSARPTNPNPPASPAGLVVTDPETGGKLNVNWTASSETDLKSYEVKWGTQSGVYSNTHNVGKNAFDTLNGLVNGQTYYVVVTATNTSDRVSAPSVEATGIPSFVRGVRSPQLVTSLRVDKSGASAVLSWNAVTTDIYGKPATIASYEVYRGTTPTFVPAPGNRLGSPAGTTFTDVDALSVANPSSYYLVRAVDVSGNVGGLGNQLPNGIDTLTIGRSPDGLGGTTLSFSWPAVTLDFDLRFPVVIDHYEVYGTDHAFTRADIRNGLVPLLASPTANAWTTPAPAVNRSYYSILAVDVRGNKSSF